MELGSRGGAAAGTLTIDPGATLTGAVEVGKVVAATVQDDGAIVMAPPAQGLTQRHLTGNLTGSGTLTTIANSDAYVDGSLTGLSAVNLATTPARSATPWPTRSAAGDKPCSRYPTTRRYN